MRYLSQALLLFFSGATAQAQIAFINKTSLLNPQDHYSGVAIAVLDMNGDGRDDIARMDAGHVLSVARQTAPNQAFSTLSVQNIATESQWGMCAADVDNNGFPDVLAGGYYDNVKIAMANSDASGYSVVELTTPGTFVQCVNFADINNDGWVDAFVCHDHATSRIYGNDGAGNFVYQPDWIDLSTFPASDNSGNYGSVWCDVDNDNDLDLYIAKCRQGVTDPTDGRRINQLFLNNGDGTYTQDLTNASGLRIGAQSWTADFGDIDNDGDFDCFVTNHDVKSQLLENDGAGHFTDISVASGIEVVGGLPIQGVFRDFDNDGYVDIIVAGSEQYLLRNNADKTFTALSGLFDNNIMESFGIGDLNADGFQDVYAGYAIIYTEPSNIPDALWLNVGNDNHFFGLNLRGIQSNFNAVGAKVKLYSALGTQIREVRSGESYGIQNSMQIHFGMGAITQIDSVEVRWPSGHIDKLYQPDVDQYLTLEEGGCQVPSALINAEGPTTFCSGDSVLISAPEGFTYLWNTGETGQSIVASTEGTYQVTVSVFNGCSAVSNAIAVHVDPVETPTVSVAGDTTFCAGGSVVLTASPAASYLWSNGETTSSITVTEAGNYFVNEPGLCGTFNSEPVTIHVLSSALPVVSGDTVLLNEIAVLHALGDSLRWYDAPGGNLIGTGDTISTLPLQASAVYWVSNTTVYDMPNAFVGQVNHQGTPFGGSQYNGGLVFDCYTPVRLAQVKVYTSIAGVRKIDLKDAAGQVLETATFNIPIGTTLLNLNFDLPVGNDLLLTTDETVNQASFTTVSPQLRRSDQGIAFPYVVPGVLSIKTSNIASDRYYYFYNWELDFPGLACESEAVPVTAVVDTTSSVTGSQVPDFQVSLFPNPTNGTLRADFENINTGRLHFRLCNQQGQLLQAQQLEVISGPFTQMIELGNLPKGIYNLEWVHSGGVWRKRVVVQ